MNHQTPERQNPLNLSAGNASLRAPHVGSPANRGLYAAPSSRYILRFQQAAKLHLEALLETGRPIPPACRDKFILPA